MIRWLKNLMSPGENKMLPYTVAAYLHHYHKPEHRQPWHHTRWVALDTETSGFQKESQVLAIGAVGINHGCIDVHDSLEIFLQHEGNPNGESISVHGIMPDHSKRGMEQKEAIATLLAYLQNSIIIAHNAHYDVAMLNRMIGKHYPLKLKNKVLDTAALAVRLEQFGVDEAAIARQDYTLDQLCARYQVPISDRHTAAGDAMLAAQLFLKLANLAKKRKISTIGDFI